MLVNLLSNAVNVTPPGTRVAIRAAVDADGGVAVSVCDDGGGMDCEAHGTPMRPFRQGDEGLSRRHDGFGLGLPLTARLMDGRGRRLKLATGRDRGTCATLRFPAWRRRDTATPSA